MCVFSHFMCINISYFVPVLSSSVALPKCSSLLRWCLSCCCFNFRLFELKENEALIHIQSFNLIIFHRWWLTVENFLLHFISVFVNTKKAKLFELMRNLISYWMLFYTFFFRLEINFLLYFSVNISLRLLNNNNNKNCTISRKIKLLCK